MLKPRLLSKLSTRVLLKKSNFVNPQKSGTQQVTARQLSHSKKCGKAKLSFDYKSLLVDPGKVAIDARNRGVYDCDPHLAASLYKEMSSLKAEINQLRSNLNSVSKKMSKLNLINPKNRKNGKTSYETVSDLVKSANSGTEHQSSTDAISEKQTLQDEAKDTKALIKEKSAQLEQIEESLFAETIKFPNSSHPNAPIGDESQAVTVEMVGSLVPLATRQEDSTSEVKDEAPLKYRDNAELCESLGIADFQSAARVSGSRFHYWKGAGVLLELGLIQYTMQRAIEFGFVPYTTPELVRSSVVDGCGFRPRPTNANNTGSDPSKINETSGSATTSGGEPSQIYRVTPVAKDEVKDSDDPLCLIATSEIPLTAMYSDQLLDAKKVSEKPENLESIITQPKYGWFGNGEKFAKFAQWSMLKGTSGNSSVVSDKTQKVKENQIPIGVVGFSHCFRSEAGSRGRDTRGLYRLHQFSKVELVVLTTPETSDNALDFLVTFQKSICQDLGLTFRILDMPTAELGASAYRKYDIEAYMPGRGNWGEVSSASNCTDYQSRRLDIRFRSDTSIVAGGGKPTQFAHTLNATACAIPRIVAAILETHQQPDGSVKIPHVLLPYMMGITTLN